MVKALKSKGLSVFFDYEAMLVHAKADARGGMNSAMALNIQSAAAVVVCFTETYEKSKNCMRELIHADNNDKFIYCQCLLPASPFSDSLFSYPPPQHTTSLHRHELHGARVHASQAGCASVYFERQPMAQQQVRGRVLPRQPSWGV